MLEASTVDVDIRIVRRPSAGCSASKPLRSVRPSLLDQRFRGDAWIVIADEDGFTSLYLENSCLARLRLLSFDVAALNGTLQQMRWCRPSRRPNLYSCCAIA